MIKMILSGTKEVEKCKQVWMRVNNSETGHFGVCCNKSQISYLSEFKYRVTFDKRLAKWRQQISILNWNNELLKKLTDRTIPKQFGGGKKRETLKLGSLAFSENGLLLPQWSAGCKGRCGMGVSCTAGPEKGVLNLTHTCWRCPPPSRLPMSSSP